MFNLEFVNHHHPPFRKALLGANDSTFECGRHAFPFQFELGSSKTPILVAPLTTTRSRRTRRHGDTHKSTPATEMSRKLHAYSLAAAMRLARDETVQADVTCSDATKSDTTTTSLTSSEQLEDRVISDERGFQSCDERVTTRLLSRDGIEHVTLDRTASPGMLSAPRPRYSGW